MVTLTFYLKIDTNFETRFLGNHSFRAVIPLRTPRSAIRYSGSIRRPTPFSGPKLACQIDVQWSGCSSPQRRSKTWCDTGGSRRRGYLCVVPVNKGRENMEPGSHLLRKLPFG